jgi:hypothetical protein
MFSNPNIQHNPTHRKKTWKENGCRRHLKEYKFSLFINMYFSIWSFNHLLLASKQSIIYDLCQIHVVLFPQDWYPGAVSSFASLLVFPKINQVIVGNISCNLAICTQSINHIFRLSRYYIRQITSKSTTILYGNRSDGQMCIIFPECCLENANPEDGFATDVVVIRESCLLEHEERCYWWNNIYIIWWVFTAAVSNWKENDPHT